MNADADLGTRTEVENPPEELYDKELLEIPIEFTERP